MRKVILSGMLGNALEWYDYALYAQFAPIIAEHFFPSSEIKEILTFAVFAAGFFVRPVGGIVFGRIGDIFGRRAALVIGILTMSIPTAGIGLLPGYNSIGILAPIMLTVFRLIQGFSLGGEFSSCITYIVEHSPPKTRGLAGSASFMSMCLGMLLGSVTAILFSYYMSEEILNSWGWRIPFILGMLIGLLGFYIRTHLSESPIYKAAKAQGGLSKRPLHELLAQYKAKILIAMGIYLTVTGPFYTCTVFIENMMKNLDYNSTQASTTSSMILVVMILIFPASAALSDKIGRKPVLYTSAFVIAGLCYPTFLAIQDGEFGQTLLMTLLLAMAVGFYMGPVPTMLVELFPTRIRLTGVALSYNLSAAIFGGTTPMIGMILSKMTGNQFALAYYLISLAIISIIALIKSPETYKQILFKGE